MNKNWAEHEEKRIILKETPACQNVFEVGIFFSSNVTDVITTDHFQVFLKYLYTGKIQVDYANVIPILQLADKYNVKDLLRWRLIVHCVLVSKLSMNRVGLDFMSRNVALAARKNQVMVFFFMTNSN